MIHVYKAPVASEDVAAIVDGTVSNQRLSKAFGRFIGRSFQATVAGN